MKSYFSRHFVRVEVTFDGIGDLLLKVPQVLALRRNAALAGWGVPEGDKETGIFARLDSEDYLVHIF